MRIDQIVVLSARSCNQLNSFRNYDNMIDNEILVLEIKVTQDLSGNISRSLALSLKL